MKEKSKFLKKKILYIRVRDERREALKMAVANLKKVDDKLKDMYSEQVTTNVQTTFVDRSDLLFEQMNFIAFNNKQALHLI